MSIRSIWLLNETKNVVEEIRRRKANELFGHRILGWRMGGTQSRKHQAYSSPITKDHQILIIAKPSLISRNFLYNSNIWSHTGTNSEIRSKIPIGKIQF